MNKAIEFIALLLLIISAVVTGQNCSTYNPCGQYGYCVDSSLGDWECQCKFWWNGTVCNELTSSGIQVITLGVLLAVLIIIFYGLSIFCSIHRKKQEPEKEIKRVRVNSNNAVNPKLTHITLTNIKQSTRFSSCINALLTLIIATLALIIKWLLLQPIHNELVNKYKQNEPLYYKRISFCNLIDLNDFNMLTFPTACFLILLFIIFSKRTSCMREKCKGYIAPVPPLDFYIHIKRKFAAVVFAIIADELLDIITQVLTDNGSSDEGVIVVFLLRIAKVIVIGFRYYPLLSAVYIDSLFTLTCASFYAWLDFTITIIYQSLCQSDYYPSDDNFNETNGTDIQTYFQYYGTGQNLIIIEVFTNIPRYICWSYIVIKLPILLIHKIMKHRNGNQTNRLHLTREEKLLLHSSSTHSVEMSYVRNLFRPIERRSPSRVFLAHLIPKFIYEWRDDFRFSSRIFCVYSSVFLLLFFLTVQACISILPYLDDLQKSLQNIINSISTSIDGQTTEIVFPMPNFVRPYLFAIFTACIITIIQLLVLLGNIRRNLLQIFRGDDSEIPKRNKDKYLDYGTGNFHFAGYFIGYLIWGYFLITIFAVIIYICIDSFITFGSVRFLENLLKKIIPVLLIIFFKQYLNKILARYVFLQHYGEILAINNRRLLMIFLYFNFFLDSFLGFISSIIRIIKSVIGGFLYMSRLDYSPLGRKLETLDAGFTAYCGFIHIEAVHRNPVMLVVASYLYSRMKAKEYRTKNALMMIDVNKKKSKMIRKWHVGILLIQNPSLKILRKNTLLQIANEKMNTIIEIKRRESRLEEMSHRPSLVSESDLQNIWHKKD